VPNIRQEYFFSMTQTKAKAAIVALRECPFGGEDKRPDRDPPRSSQIWTSAICRNNPHVSFLSASQDEVRNPK
jgi:hypothetical protein